MGYFSNSDDGHSYEARWCNRCIQDMGEEGCAIMAMHFLYNYDQNDGTPEGKAIKDALEFFIPRKKGRNRKCRMFVNRKKLRKKYRPDGTPTT
jgi:hypothetical protein